MALAAVIVAFGGGKMETVAVPVARCAAAVVTVVVSVADGVAVAVNVTWLVVEPAVIVPPLVIDQA
jgi:hypothetical protein